MTVTKLVVSLCTWLAVVVTAREARWFLQRSTVTRYLRQHQVHTEFVPSSCVVLEESIKPCRHLRQLLVHPTPSSKMASLLTGTPRLEQSPIPPHPLSSPPQLSGSLQEPDSTGYWSWLSLSPVTVTHTLKEIVTARAVTPAVMVTFSVRGCQPSQLPFGLPLCQNSTSANNTTATATARISSVKDLHFVDEIPNKDTNH